MLRRADFSKQADGKSFSERICRTKGVQVGLLKDYFVNQTIVQQKTDRVAGTIMAASRALQ